MGLENKHGQMEHHMRAIGKTIALTAKESSFILMEMYMKEIG